MDRAKSLVSDNLGDVELSWLDKDHLAESRQGLDQKTTPSCHHNFLMSLPHSQHRDLYECMICLHTSQTSYNSFQAYAVS